MNDRYAHGLAALQFFGLSGEKQVASARSISYSLPRFYFPEQSEEDCGCEYFYGIACLFIEQVNILYNEFLTTEDVPNLSEFHKLMHTCMMGGAEEWSESAALSHKNWVRLRDAANKALNEIGESLPENTFVVDFRGVINPTDFRTSDEARRLLD